MVSATLAGRTPHMKSAGVIALSRLYYEFKNEEAMQVNLYICSYRLRLCLIG